MKLRIRSLESKETHRIEVPSSCNLQQLKEAIIRQLSLSSSSSSSAIDGNLLLSLNRKDELYGSSPDESLQTLGLASGDLIYYSFNPFAFSAEIRNLSNPQRDPRDQNRNFGDTQMPESSNLAQSTAESDQTLESKDAIKTGPSKLSDTNRNLVHFKEERHMSNSKSIATSDETQGLMDTQMEGLSKLSAPNDQTQDLVNPKKEEHIGSPNMIDETKGVEEMEVDDDESLLEATTSTFSVPSFLKKVFVKEVGDAANGGDHKLLVIAVHAVLLESGFVAYDSVLGKKVDGFHLRDERPKSLHYTLPELASSEVVETVVLKFQTLGKFLKIYGSVSKKGFGVHGVSLDETRFVPALSVILKKRDCTDSGKLYPTRELFEFWKIVKDGLSYALVIDLCEKAGLVPPPCFMLLPTDLKLKILETLPAVDVARMSCVSSELHFVASNNELWRLKYEEEFGNAADPQRECQWKAKFSTSWEIRKRRKRVRMPYPWREPPLFRPVFPGRRDPNLPGSPFIIGGDYDRLPSFGVPQNHGPRIFRWNCNLGGFGP